MFKFNIISRKTFFVFYIIFASISTSAQTHKIEILKRQLSLAKTNLEKVGILIGLCHESNSLPRDSLYKYALDAEKEALILHDENSLAMANYYIAVSLRREKFSDSSLRICNTNLQKLTYTQNRAAYVDFQLMKVDIVFLSGNSESAINDAYKLLQFALDKNDTIFQIEVRSSIGSMFSDLHQYTDGLRWLYDAQNTSLNPIFDEVKNSSVLFFNLGLDYNYQGKFDSAEYYADKTLEVSRKYEDLNMLAYGLGLKSYIFSFTNRPVLAEKPMTQALHILKEIGNTYSVINAMVALAKYYASSGQPKKGILTCKEALVMLNKYPLVPKELIYDQLATNYKISGNYRKYAKTLNTIIKLKDSTYRKNSATAMAELNAKYFVTYNEALIAKQNLQLIHKDIWIGIFVLIILVISGGFYFLFQINRRKHIKALVITKDKERRRIAADLHDNIGAYASAISARIDEIERNNLISDSNFVYALKNYIAEIITSLRDTIWAFNKESVSLIDLSDRIKLFIQKIQIAYPYVIINLKEENTGKDIFSPFHSLHVFRIIQESIHNALRHSKGNTINVYISENKDSFLLYIEDNGEGFDLELIDQTGNGIMNMKRRAEDSGFELSFSRVFPKGMKVMLTGRMKKNVGK